MTVPTKHKAVIVKDKSVVVEEVPVPKIASDELLVKTVSLSINPTDWKHVKFGFAPNGSVLGCDFAGNVVAVGDKVTDIKIGDSGYGFVSGGSVFEPENGAYAEYVRIKRRFFFTNHLVKNNASDIPIGPITSYESAAFLGIPIITVGMAFHFFGLSIFDKPSPASKGKTLFIWGGATALGYLGIQFGHRLGFNVIAVASKKHEKVLRELGAAKIFDYHDSDVIDQIKQYAGDDIEFAADFISDEISTENTISVASKTKPVKIASVIPTAEKGPANVKFQLIISYLAICAEKKMGDMEKKSTPELMQWGETFIKKFSEEIAKDPKFVLHEPIKVLSGGLSSISEGLSIVEEGKNSGFKVIINL